MIKDLCEKLGFPQDCHDELEKALAKLLSEKRTAELIMQSEESLFEGDFRHDDLLKQASDISGIHRYTVDLVFILYCARSLKYVYANKGFSDELFYNTMRDLKCKLNECRTIHGINGIFTLKWYRRFFLCRLFALGRLEYGINEFIYDDWKNGTLKRGDLVFDCHIPSSGEPFTPDAVMDSLRTAYKFFKQTGHLKGDIMTVVCHSYLLYPKTLQLFPENGNVRKFAALFDPVNSVEEPDNPNFWRIFGRDFPADRNFDGIELNTTLRRNFAKYLADGKNMGLSYGVMQFDGEKTVATD